MFRPHLQQQAAAQPEEDTKVGLKYIYKSSDPFKDLSLTIDSFEQEQIVDEGDVYHRTLKINFSKNNITVVPTSEPVEQNLSDIIDESLKTYVNSNFLTSVNADPTSLQNAPAGSPTHFIQTVRNREQGSESDLSEFQKRFFYDPDVTGDQLRNVIFDSTESMSGVPKPQTEGQGSPQMFNRFDFTYPEHGKLVDDLNDASVGQFPIYERMQILAGHYGQNILEIEQEDVLTLQMIIDNYDYSFPLDAYYVSPGNSVELGYELNEKIILRQIKKTISKSSPTYFDILADEPSKNEILFYKIEKWFDSDALGPSDQTFFIPAVDNSKTLIDTNIVGDRPYTYRITGYYAIIGAEYFFTDIYDNGDNTGYCTVEVRPTIKLQSYNVAEESLINIPPPPLPPFVSFHNKFNSSGELKIYLQTQKGERIEVFQDLSYDGINIVGSNYVIDKNTDNEKIKFRHVPSGAKFQIFRMQEKPHEYQDFETKKIGDFQNTDTKENMVVLDKIQSNTKYYYTFRSANDFGSFSNPTPVYEVELLQDADNSRVHVEICHLEGYPKSTSERKEMNFQSLLGLTLTNTQKNFDLENARDPDGLISTFEDKLDLVTCGYEDWNGPIINKAWGRKFKFRVRSNDSAKIVDFNVKVNLIREES